jgi:hypothetical protein
VLTPLWELHTTSSGLIVMATGPTAQSRGEV